MSSVLGASETPRKWRFTWEAISHKPTLKLFLFDCHTNPSKHCKNLRVDLSHEQSLLLVSWFEAAQVRLRVPIPRVLLDFESPVSFRAMEDHIEVKLLLLLPVDHPIVSGFDSLLSEGKDGSPQDAATSNEGLPLSMDYDLKPLSSKEGVDFYCRNCSTKLTKQPLRNFSELPSVNWREVADNWFGACCCSFGGISEKLVFRYANLNTCSKGACQLSTTFVVLCKNDILGCKFTDYNRQEKKDHAPSLNSIDVPNEAAQDSGKMHARLLACENQRKNMDDATGNSSFMQIENASLAVDVENVVTGKNVTVDDLICKISAVPTCCSEAANLVQNCKHESSEYDKPLENQKSFLSGFVGNVFMARASNISKDVDWIEFLCPKCSFILGAYPSVNGHASSDGGVQLFKCNISTCLPVGGSDDVFRKYTLTRMFANQLLESAQDELSFRTMINDLKTKSPMIQVVLLNADSRSCSGYCLCTEATAESFPEIHMHPGIKVLFSDCSRDIEAQSSLLKDWVSKHLADEVYMFAHQINELKASLQSARESYPPSFVFQQGLSLSHIQR